ncbi:MAG: hypothetical protein ACJ768_09380 [Gaiellaceae bacterium]
MSLGPLANRAHEAPAAAAAPSPGGGGRLPAPGWPEKADLDYAKTALELALLLLALPYILSRLARSPGNVVKRAGHKQLPPS